MRWRDRRRGWIAFSIAALVLGWSVLAFGSPMDPPQPETGFRIPYRTVSRLATLLGALLCFYFLPGRRRFPLLPRSLAVAMGFLLLYGWFMVANAYADHSLVTWRFTYAESRISWAPGTVARSTSMWFMIELTAVALAMLVALRACETAAWRGLLAIIAGSGAVVAVVGLLHKATHAETVWWIVDGSQPAASVFAPFVYNANAAAYMNLCLPLAMGLAFSRVGDERGRASGVVWAMISVLIVAGVLVAASKGGIIVVVLTVPVMLFWNRARLGVLVSSFFVQRGRRIERLVQLAALGALILSLVAIGLNYVLTRWKDFMARFDDPSRVDLTGRLEIMKVMMRMAGWEEGSWHGFGPGTFRHLLPYYNLDSQVSETDWTHGHCDPLQTLVEWGWIGALAWFVIGAGAVGSALLLLRRRIALTVQETPLVRGAVVGLVMVGLHSCQDFPLSIYSIHLVAMLLCAVCWGLFATRRPAARTGGGG